MSVRIVSWKSALTIPCCEFKAKDDDHHTNDTNTQGPTWCRGGAPASVAQTNRVPTHTPLAPHCSAAAKPRPTTQYMFFMQNAWAFEREKCVQMMLMRFGCVLESCSVYHRRFRQRQPPILALQQTASEG